MNPSKPQPPQEDDFNAWLKNQPHGPSADFTERTLAKIRRETADATPEYNWAWAMGGLAAAATIGCFAFITLLNHAPEAQPQAASPAHAPSEWVLVNENAEWLDLLALAQNVSVLNGALETLSASRPNDDLGLEYLLF